MANRFWVGGTGNWSDDTNHWATTSGGAPGLGNLPTISDNAVFDANSNVTSYTVTLDVGPICQDLNLSAAPSGSGTITLAGSANTTVNGSLVLLSGMTYSYTGDISFTSNSTGKLITTNGVALTSNINFTGNNGAWALQDDLVTSAIISHSFGAFDANNKNVKALSLNSTANASNKTITMGSGTWELTGTGIVLDVASASTVQWIKGTSTIKITDASAADKTIRAKHDVEFYNVWFSNAGTGKFTFIGNGGNFAVTFNDLKVDTPPHTINIAQLMRIKLNTFTVNGTSGNLITIDSTSGVNHFFEKVGTGTISSDYLSLSKSTAEPSGSWFAGDHSTDVGNNVGWIFTRPNINKAKINYEKFPRVVPNLRKGAPPR